MNFLSRLGAISRAALLPCILGAMAVPVPAYNGTYTPQDLFPLDIGYTWTVRRAVAGGTEQIVLSTHRQESVGGALTTVLQVKKDLVLLEEWYLSTTLGLSAHRVRFFAKDFQGVQADIDATFLPALRLTGATVATGIQTNSSGIVSATFSAGGPPAITAPYTASSTIAMVGDFAATPGAFSVGARIVTTLGVAGPFGGFLATDIFFGRMLGPIKMDFGGTLAGSAIDEKKWLEDTNVDAELTNVFSAHSPTNRATQVGGTVTAFAAIVNGGSVAATWCGFRPLPDKDGLPYDFSYAQTNSSNQVIPDDPTIGAGQAKFYVFAIKPTVAFGFKRIRFVHDCWESPPALRTKGLNDFGIFASAGPTPDPLMIGITVGNTNIVDIPSGLSFTASAFGTGAFAVAAVNLGAAGTITVSGAPLDPATPVSVTVCPTEPLTGLCQQPPTPDVTFQWAALENRTFAFFATALADIPFDPANSRIEAKAVDDQGNQLGGWNTAVRTVPATP